MLNNNSVSKLKVHFFIPFQKLRIYTRFSEVKLHNIYHSLTRQFTLEIYILSLFVTNTIVHFMFLHRNQHTKQMHST